MQTGNIAIIPARGGSKRIPRKSVRNFMGKPVIAYAIETAILSGLFDEIMVSTDDKEIAETAIKLGAKVPFIRSEKNADDFASTADVLLEVLEQYSTRNMHFESGCCIYPAAPLIQLKHLQEGYQNLISKNLTSVFPGVAFSHPVWRGLEVLENGKTQLLWPEHTASRSQDLKQVYHDAGQWYWFNINTFLEVKKLFTDNTSILVLPEAEVQDIDNESDWLMAELKYKLLNAKK